MKTYFFPAILSLLLFAGQASANLPGINETKRFIFHSIHEGLYEDGVATEDIEQILMKRKGEEYFHFIYACPACNASIWAFDAYRKRPEKLHCVKTGDSTFNYGLGKKIRDDLHSDDVTRRLSAINTLIERWINQRMDKLRLTKEERADLLDKLEGLRDSGRMRLKQFRLQKKEDGGASLAMYAPAYVGKGDWECAVCRAVVNKPMKFGEKKTQPE